MSAAADTVVACAECGKPIRYATPSGRCLTCEYRARHTATLIARAAAEDTLSASAFPTARAPHDDATAVLEVPPTSRDEPPSTSASRRTSAGGRTLPTSPTLPYAPAEVLASVGEYDLLRELGHGGMGVVYRAYARRLGRYVALKLIRAGVAATDIDVARFVNEAMLAARLSHPNIVRVYDARETPSGESYFVMELIEGGTLGDRLRRGLRRDDEPDAERVSLRQAIELLEKTARAVQHAHDKGIIHRDLKPENILVDEAGELHVTDFGIAKGIEMETRTDLTAAGHVMGSPQYMSPEQANGELSAIGPRSDVYALGATLYHVLAGRPMFEGPSAMAIVLQVISAEPKRPAAVAADAGLGPVPLDLETICLKATEKESARRYATAGELADELRRWLDGEPILARPVGAFERARKKLRKNRRLLIGAFMAATLVLVLGAAFTLSLFDNVRRSSRSLAALDRREALSQAATVERAIRVNMLQGRADLARALIHRLAKDETAGRIHVLRTDGTAAYVDRTTRKRVERRLARPEVVSEISRKHPELLDQIEELRSRAFPRIDKSAPEPERPVRVSLRHFRGAVTSKKPVTYIEETPRRERRLVVLKPIENSERCQACHGSLGDGYDDFDNSVRAVLVVRRPLDHVERVIASNRRATWLIGSGTAATLLLLIYVYVRLFGLGAARRRFGGDA